MGSRATLVNFDNECARRQRESHILKRSRPQSVNRSQFLKTNVHGAKARATYRKRPALNM
eukprot:1997734-Pyramimonas_sp.AAC.1